jgi:spore maturation protein CgeB
MLYPLVNKLEKEVHIFGRGWKNDPNVRGATLHGVVDWRDIKRVYAQTDIVLGMTAQRAIELDGINGRVFEALGCGSFFISDNAPAISRMFSAGKELVTFQDGEDIVGLVESYLDSKELRDSIAGAGHEKAKTRDIVANHAKAIFESASRL